MAQIDHAVCHPVAASIWVNSSLRDEFHFERGLHQGDPLSPFLFLIAVKGLNVIMSALICANLLPGYKVGQTADDVCVSHLQFASST